MRLESYRWRKQLQVSQLADQLDLSISHVSRILSGEALPGTRAAAAIKKLTGIRFPALAQGKKRPFSEPAEAESG